VRRRYFKVAFRELVFADDRGTGTVVLRQTLDASLHERCWGLMPEDKYVGGEVVAIWHRSLTKAVSQLLTLGSDKLKHLKVRSGEHLAAILTTAFLEVPPSELDLDGGVDLIFSLPENSRLGLLSVDAGTAAFEIKSMPGPYRVFEDNIDRVRASGVDPIGLSMDVKVRTANDILVDAEPLLARAAEALARKVKDGVSRHAFLVIHPFDHFAVECYESPFIAAVLAAPPCHLLFDSIWVLWVPSHLTVWSTPANGWVDIHFDSLNPDEDLPKAWEHLAALQAVESEFLDAVNASASSPYLFGLN
jgi:hypothetical protein